VETAVVLSGLLLGGFFGGWEIALVLAVVLILLAARRLPELSRGLGQGLREFWKATHDVSNELNPKESGLVYEALTGDSRTAEFVYPHQSDLPGALRTMILFVAQGFGVGRIPFAPGTFGSLVGLAWFAALLATRRYEVYLLGALAGVGLSVWFCGAAEKILKQKDPSSVVLDEIIALPFCFLPWVTHAWLSQHKLPALETLFTRHGLLVAAGIFVLFRMFDILKPWPIRRSQRLPGGWGVTVDDLLAALYVALLSLLFVH
jgi:phosphatidylglycerophosphatase A